MSEDPIVLKAKQLQPVIKAKKLARVAKANGWSGTLDSEVIDSVRTTTLQATRNDEAITVCYTDNTMTYGVYRIFDRIISLQCASDVKEKLQGWPDLLKLLKWFPRENKPNLVNTYRHLPFSFDEPNDVIISKLLERKLFWYSHEGRKIEYDVPLPLKTKTSKQKTRIVDVGHRKLFHFIGVQVGFRSMLLDTLIKVG